ncbi:MAG: transglutaminase-like domain-containing protein, partial [Planctomycetota bacterium]
MQHLFYLLLFLPFYLITGLYAQETKPLCYREILDASTPAPQGWTLDKRVEVPAEQLGALSHKLGAKITRLTNTSFLYEKQAIQINVVDCETTPDAEALYQRFLSLHKGNKTFVLLDHLSVIEFTHTSFKTAVRAHYDLGFKPRRVTYQLSFSAAPLQKCNYMQWNPLFNLFLLWDQGNTQETMLAQIKELSAQFQFGNTFYFRTIGQGTVPSEYTFDPYPEKKETDAFGEVFSYTFKEVPLKAGIPNIQVHATVVSEAFTITPSSRQSEEVLVKETSFWPSTDPVFVALAQEITKNATTTQQKIDALLQWLEPGKNIRYAGEQKGSRYGVEKVLEQKFGHCWDFSDCFI